MFVLYIKPKTTMHLNDSFENIRYCLTAVDVDGYCCYCYSCCCHVYSCTAATIQVVVIKVATVVVVMLRLAVAGAATATSL